MYTDDKTTQIVISMLKAYNIKNIILSPGTRNSAFSASIQCDSFFKPYSVVDERSAGYFATGLAFETNEPVVICCTGATASRNYLSALTEAFYRKLPIIAITFGYEYGDLLLTPQYIDRSTSQNDIKLRSTTLPQITGTIAQKRCELLLNDTLIKCIYGRGPVHINILHFTYKFCTTSLPTVHKIEYNSAYTLIDNLEVLLKNFSNKRIGIFIGSHNKMSPNLTYYISKFAEKYHAPVFVDHTSNYHGKNKVLIAQICDILETENLPDIMIDLGEVCGQYSLSRLFKKASVWRLSDSLNVKQRAGLVTHLFHCDEEYFFKCFSQHTLDISICNYFEEITKELEDICINDLPFSTPYIAQQYIKRIPAGSIFHASILNSLRSINFFEFATNIDVVSNVGGFGIDGALSTLLGQSLTNRLCFAQIGDLAFFYDMNALGNRHIKNNIRILLINNGLGAEFAIDQQHQKNLDRYNIDEFIAAQGHFGKAKEWAVSCGFDYMSASSKEEFLSNIDIFCNPDIAHFKHPVLFEVFTKKEDEIIGINTIRASKKRKEKIPPQNASLLSHPTEQHRFRDKLLSCLKLK